ncbi:MAG: CxxxxCH/CxxCH domain-containing protein [Kofleriaceae bacterium]
MITQRGNIWILCLAAIAVAGCDLGEHEPNPEGEVVTSGPSIGCSGSCHGQGESIAPPRDSAGRTDLTSIGVGAHQAHLRSADWHKRFTCETCHVVPKEVGDLGHVFVAGANGQPEKDVLPAELTPSGLGTGLQWDHATETCTNSYCHGDSLKQVDPATNMVVLGAGGTVTKPVWTLVDGSQSACGTCHGNPPPAPHPQNTDCGLCHQSMNPGDYDAGKFSYPELHINGLVEIATTQPCDSCHGTAGRASPPRDAHGNTQTTAPGVGAHAQHLTTNSTWHAPLACNECHLVPGSTADQTHLDGTNEVYLDPTTMVPGSDTGTGGLLQIPGAAYNAGNQTCTNTYCHGGGGSPLKGGNANVPKWTKVDGTQATCESCHGHPPPAPHPQNSNCGSCHPTMVAGGDNRTIALPAKHLDGSVDIIGDQACDTCHGSGGISAPPKDTTGGTNTNLRTVGAHRSHLNSPSTWHADVTCDQCHRVPTSTSSIGHIDTPLPAELTFGNLAGQGATWNGTTCSNTYCHGATLKSGTGSAGGTATRPVWTIVDGSQSQCSSCHGAPPPAPHPVDTDCGKCHSTMTAGGGLVITDPTRHIDGNVDVNGEVGCNTCHGGTVGNAPPKDTQGNTNTNTRGVGAHQSHLNPSPRFFKAIVCTDCHLVPAALNSLGHRDTPLPAEVRFGGRAGTSPTWNGAQCSNVYCHGATLTSGTGGAGGTATSPLWTKVDGTQRQCTSCHGFPPPAPHPQNSDCGACHLDVKPGSNQEFLDVNKHIDGNLDVNTAAACNTCHGGGNNAPPQDTTGGTTTTLRGVGAHQSHIAPGGTAWHRDVQCMECHRVPGAVNSVGHIDTALPAELTFSGIASGSTWTGSNCTSYCHGSSLGGGNAKNPLWTRVDGTQKQCTSCHGAPPPAPHPQDSSCENCHAPAGPGMTIDIPAQHIDGTLQVTSIHPAGYNARESHGYDFDKKGPSTCATASCHGVALNGGGGPSCQSCHTSGWQTDCKFCHGSDATGAPPQGVLGATARTDKTVGAHAKHLGATTMHAAWDCTMCHVKPTSATAPGHVDGAGTVVQAELKYSSLNPSGAYNFGTATCTNLYCHGTGRANGTAPAWTSTSALTCLSCHGGDPNRTGMSSEHRRDKHRKSCNTCHKTVVNSTPAIINAGLHVNGAKDVSFITGTYNAAAKSCTGTGNGCHGNGTRNGWK